MNTLWFFGDSFIEYWPNWGSAEKTWVQLLCDKYQDHHPMFLGLGGAGNDYTNYMFNLHKDNIKENDMVVVIITGFHRKLISSSIKNKLNYINTRGKGSIELDRNNIPDPHTLFNQNISEKDEEIQYFTGNLYNPTLELSIVDNFIDCLQYYTITRNLTTVVLPAWNMEILHNKNDIITGINKELVTVYKDQKGVIDADFLSLEAHYLTRSRNPENLRNHLFPANHKVLADKIIFGIENQDKTIDLNGGWE